MELEHSQDSRPKTIRNLRIAIVSAAVALGLAVLFETNRQPRTDDAEVLANFIGIAPQVEGPIVMNSRGQSPSRLHWKGRSRTTAERLQPSRAPWSWRERIARVPRRICSTGKPRSKPQERMSRTRNRE